MPINRLPRVGQRWLSYTAAGLATLTGGATLSAGPAPANLAAVQRPALYPEFDFHYDHLLGTSMDMILAAPSSELAGECERQVLAEIDRLSAILSTYDPNSEISHVMNGGSIRSDELAKLLALYDLWTARTGGALHVNLAGVKDLWNVAEREAQLPDPTALRNAFNHARSFNVDALGKGFIIDHAVEVARRIAPCGLLNIGGDIRAWGDQTWPIGIANPIDYADNAPPLAVFPLRNAAVASSGGYARYFTINGTRYSHIIDPRTLSPVADIYGSSTVVASDCVTSNALSTAMCVLDVVSAEELVNAHANGHLTKQGDKVYQGGKLGAISIAPSSVGSALADASSQWPASSGGTVSREVPVANASAKADPTGALAPARVQAEPLAVWAKDYRMQIDLVLKKPDGAVKVRSPYVVIWIETDAGHPVRNITLWGKQDKYLPHLSTWWKLINMNLQGAKSMAAATRPAGKYTLYWDGRDDRGKIQPQGKYVVHIEISREHGTHVESTVTVDCSGMPDSQMVSATAESEESKIEYKRGTR